MNKKSSKSTNYIFGISMGSSIDLLDQSFAAGNMDIKIYNLSATSGPSGVQKINKKPSSSSGQRLQAGMFQSVINP
jgi:hypothetical protein